MERIQTTVLAVLIAALVLFGLGYVVDGPEMLAWRGGSTPEERVRIALWNNDDTRETRRRGAAVPPGGEESRSVKRRRAGLGPEVVGDDGPGRRRGGFFSDGTVGADGEPRGGISSELIAARAGMLPANGASRDREEPPPPQSAPQNDPDDDVDPDLLLSVPFDGSVNGENGDTATVAEGVLFNGDSVEFTNEARVIFPAEGNVESANGTISFDLTPRWSGTDPSSNSFLQIRDGEDAANSLQIVKDLGNLHFTLTDWRGIASDISVPITDWLPGDQHHIDATWTGSEIKLYVDNVWVGSAEVRRGMRFGDDAAIQVGSVGSIYGGAGGLIGDLQIRGSALSGDQITGNTRIVMNAHSEMRR
jgi:hypothetical protein